MFAPRSLKRFALCTLSAAAIAMAPLSAQARSSPSEASAALSVLPVALSVAAPVALLVGGASLTVVAVEASANSTALVLERVSDGVRETLHFSGRLSQGVGTAIICTAISTGYVLSAAGQAIAFVPNEVGKALLYNERITRYGRMPS